MYPLTNKNVLGIVAEYNPFHNGHLYQLEKCKEQSSADYTVAVISGNFTQRGEVAILDKWNRAKMAILAGVDLVVELPFYFACNSAEYFAKGSIDILNALGNVTHLGFGSESGDVDALVDVANKLAVESDELKKAIKEKLDSGMSFPKARSEALCGEAKLILQSPNNILAIEYIKNLLLTNSSIKPVTVKRYQKGYHEDGVLNDISSATYIRQVLKEKDIDSLKGVPNTTKEILKENIDNLTFNDDENLFNLLKYKILSSEPRELSYIFSVGEGIENKVIKEIRTCNSLEELIDKVKSKRYTRTRVQRIFAHMLVGLKKDADIPQYIRVLGFNKKGSELLKEIKKKKLSTLPVVTNINKVQNINFDLDIRANDIYNLISKNDTYKYSDFIKQPVIIH